MILKEESQPPDTGMEGDIVEESGIDKAHGEVGHPSEFHRTVNIAMDFCRYCGARLIDDGVHLGRIS